MTVLKKVLSYVGIISLMAGCNKGNTEDTSKPETKPVEYMKDTAKETGKNEVLVFSVKDGRTTGVPGKLNVEVKKSPDGNFKIDAGSKVLDDAFVSSISVAAFNGALAAGKDLSGFHIILSGDMERAAFPSQAGIAAMIMAGMTGEKIRPEVAIIGTINSDGTVGPVDDLPGIIGAAVGAGKKEIAYCSGQAKAFSPSRNEFVNIEEFAKTSNIKAVKISDVYDAFKVLTGKAISLPKEVTTQEMKLSRELSGQLSGMSTNWKKTFNEYVKKYNRIRVKSDALTEKAFKTAQSYIKESDELLKKNEIAPGYDYAQRGGSFAYTSYWARRYLEFKQKRNLKGLFKTTGEFTITKQIEDTYKSFKSVKPENLGDLFALLSAYGQLSSAWAYAAEGDEFLKQTRENINYLISKKLSPAMDKDRLSILMSKTIFKYGMADNKNSKAKDFSKFVGLKGGKFVVQLDKFKKIMALMKVTATANYKYAHKKLVVDASAKSGKSVDEVAAELAATSSNYSQASSILKLVEGMPDADDFDQILAKIAGYSMVYFNSSMLILKNIALEITTSTPGKVDDVKRKEYLASLIEISERNVRIQAALAKKYSGTIPASAIFSYNIGMNMKDREFGFQIKALEMFWKASLECQLSILISN
ncbi:hypothetical protein KKF34_11745 [Myxococcota bacterium]|nr:hypothetical protein [Myxococcota bacterium]MBU1380468.1 hypothetical protein [Myxococcota bacterium]MBU1497537.1 hypothetical protein [Myxococcota bacterium]